MRCMLAFLLVLAFLSSKAQESRFSKFGKVTATDLQKKIYSIDSAADAVVLSDIGEVAIQGNSKGWFSVITTRHKLVHILTKNGYTEADVEIPLYTNGDNEERLEDIRAVTYNLDGNKVMETKMERSGVFTEKRNKELIIKKFTLPNIKEGSIIEFQYKTSSDFISQVDPWTFQEGNPCLWSEFKFSVPQFFSYAFLSHGYIKPFSYDKKDRIDNFTVHQASTSLEPAKDVSFSAGVTEYRWVMKDVPELKEESFTSTLENHLSKIEFQLASQSEPLVPHDFRGSWPALTKELLESEYFGKQLAEEQYWLSDEVKKITAGSTSSFQKAKRIYEFVRDGFTCTDNIAIHTEQSLKNTFKARKGNVAEISLLLIAMLRSVSLSADPVILSQKQFGYTYEAYPMLRRFNYVIAKVEIDNNVYYLDPAHNYLGFGKLLPAMYNGHSRIVNEQATALFLTADSLKERKVTAIFLNSNKDGWKGSVSQTPGYYESYKIRGNINEKGEAVLFKEIQASFGNEAKVENGHIDSLYNYEQPLGIRYDIQYAPTTEDVLYINPMFTEGWKKNPFTSAQRLYPVEMPYTIDETFILTMDVPEGYVVDELPKQLVAKYDEQGNSFFEYRIQQSGNIISLRSRIRLARAYYDAEEYEALRAFFAMVVKKHSEQVVLKKKK